MSVQEKTRIPITAPEIAAQLAMICPEDLYPALKLLAAHVYQARLRNGSRVLDASDCKEWLEELAEEAKR